MPRRHRRRAAAATAAAKTPLKTERRAAAPCRIAVAAPSPYTHDHSIVSVQPPLCFRIERKISDGTKSLPADLPSSQQDRWTGQELDPDRELGSSMYVRDVCAPVWNLGFVFWRRRQARRKYHARAPLDVSFWLVMRPAVGAGQLQQRAFWGS
jgi:hypothetical protein